MIQKPPSLDEVPVLLPNNSQLQQQQKYLAPQDAHHQVWNFFSVSYYCKVTREIVLVRVLIIVLRDNFQSAMSE
jgi:hypothetical protein